MPQPCHSYYSVFGRLRKKLIPCPTPLTPAVLAVLMILPTRLLHDFYFMLHGMECSSSLAGCFELFSVMLSEWSEYNYLQRVEGHIDFAVKRWFSQLIRHIRFNGYVAINVGSPSCNEHYSQFSIPSLLRLPQDNFSFHGRECTYCWLVRSDLCVGST